MYSSSSTIRTSSVEQSLCHAGISDTGVGAPALGDCSPDSMVNTLVISRDIFSIERLTILRQNIKFGSVCKLPYLSIPSWSGVRRDIFSSRWSTAQTINRYVNKRMAPRVRNTSTWSRLPFLLVPRMPVQGGLSFYGQPKQYASQPSEDRGSFIPCYL